MESEGRRNKGENEEKQRKGQNKVIETLKEYGQ